MTRTVKETVHSEEVREPTLLNGDLADVIRALQNLREAIPAEFRVGSQISVEYDRLDEYLYVKVYYERPETFAEAQARDEQDRKLDALYKNRRRAEFERLKKEFGES